LQRNSSSRHLSPQQHTSLKDSIYKQYIKPAMEIFNYASAEVSF
jgi:hypothetical protein